VSTTSRFAEIGALIGDPSRCAMLMALMDGRALTAFELASAAGVAAPTASSHLAQLVAAGLLEVVRQGRHRYHRIASPEVARMLEAVMAVASSAPSARPVCTGPRDQQLRRLRTCYDHLAGRIAVAITDAMASAGQLVIESEGARLTASGAALMRELEIEVQPGPGFVRPCLDWSERRFHLGGRFGAELQRTLVARDWVRSRPGTRAMMVTPAGRQALERRFGLDAELFG
jgi:DNA-binding transcriptional ArsR family regulator